MNDSRTSSPSLLSSKSHLDSSDNSRSKSDYPRSCSKSTCSKTECSKSECQKSECPKSECSKSECSKSDRDCSRSDWSEREDCSERNYSKEESSDSIYRVIERDRRFRKLVKLIDRFPDIVRALKTSPNLTLFAPMNDAFDGIESCGTSTIRQILLYHISSQRIPRVAFEDGKLVPSLDNGLRLRENVYTQPTFRDIVTINGAEIIIVNLRASNGVVQGIDKVLMPATENLMQVLAVIPELSTLVQLLSLASTQIMNTLTYYNGITLLAPTNMAFTSLLTALNMTIDQVTSNQTLINNILQ
ncbi:MAG: fasciclin domain-containing protein, partial [Limisphaerales bacterium]